MPSFSFHFEVTPDCIYTLRFHAKTRDEADAKMRDLLSGSSFNHWLNKLLPIDENEMGSMH